MHNILITIISITFTFLILFIGKVIIGKIKQKKHMEYRKKHPIKSAKRTTLKNNNYCKYKR